MGTAAPMQASVSQIQWISTSAAAPGEELDYWRAYAGDCGLQALGKQRFHAEAVRRSVGSILLSTGVMGPCKADWSARHVRSRSSDALRVGCTISGAAAVEQDGRLVLLTDGGAVLNDATRPSSLRVAGSQRFLVLDIPRTTVTDRVASFHRITGLDLGKLGNLLPLVRDYALQLATRTPDLDADTIGKVSSNLTDLVCAMLAEAVAQAPQDLSEYKGAALLRVRAFVEEHLSDPELTRATVAAALRLSPRYINQLLQAEGTSLARLIWRRRLERIAADLRDPALAGRSISTIALSHGFRDLSHFSAAFRQRYGMTPREHRSERRVVS